MLNSARGIYTSYAEDLRGGKLPRADLSTWRSQQIASAIAVTGADLAFRSDELVGAGVVNPQGADLGSIDDIVMDPQTGKIDLLRVARLASPDAAPAPLAPHAGWWRLHVEPRPIDIQLGADGQWQGLQALVKGGRTLTYRKL